VGWRGGIRKRFQLVNGTIAILDKERAAITDKTACPVQAIERYPERVDKQDMD
jgi:hypothetical protein